MEEPNQMCLQWQQLREGPGRFGIVKANKRLNKVVYLQLAAATVEGVAYHLVLKVEETKDGRAAWRNLVEWYDRDMILILETAENLQNKLDNLRLNTGVSESEYINKFLAWFGDLRKSRVKDYHLDMQSIYS
jgi:hypothetical protein